MLRAVQFAARFEFKIEPKTYNEIKKNARLIKTVSGERFQEEFRKLFTKSTKPSYGIKLMIDLGLMKLLFPQVKKVSGVVDRIPKVNFPAFMGVVLADLGNQAGKAAKKVMKTSLIDANSIEGVSRVIRDRTFGKNEYDVVKFTENLPAEVIDNIDSYLKASKRKTLSDMLNSIRRQGKPTNRKELSIGGRDVMDLGIRGAEIGKALDKALEWAIKDNLSREEILRKLKP
jgi:tRNA nucleotidyltransferase/poly(A) polymerase